MNTNGLLVHGLLNASRVNGPGLRAVLFVQGCVVGCNSCWNRKSHAVDGAGASMSAEDLARWISECRDAEGVAGVTFSGGEPMHQAPALAALIDRVAKQDRSMSFGMFSGYTEQELNRGRYWTREPLSPAQRVSAWSEIKAQLDFAVLGRFVAARPSRLPLRSSANQVLRLFSSKYRESDFSDPETEITIEATGLVTITGFPTAGTPA